MPEIRYFREECLGLELILSRHSRLSYPRHNHVSVRVLGIVLEGTRTLVLRNTTLRCGCNQAFSLPPYAPHSAQSMLRLCAAKRALPDSTSPSALLCQTPFQLDRRQIDLLLAEYERAQQLALPQFSLTTPVGALVDRLEKRPEVRCSLAEMPETPFSAHTICCGHSSKAAF